MKIILTAFIFTGIVDSTDHSYASVEIDMRESFGAPSMEVVPLDAFPCEIGEGDSFYIFKLTESAESVIICKESN